MKKDTTAAKFFELMGIEVPKEKIEEKFSDKPKKSTSGKRGPQSRVANGGRKFDYVAEDAIQDKRQAQGILYFLQAPELFSFKTCPHCGADFYVSRNFVSHCSYTCIKNSLAEVGIEWTKGNDLEALANDPEVFNKNEPLWIRNIDQLKAALEVLCQNHTSLSQEGSDDQLTSA